MTPRKRSSVLAWHTDHQLRWAVIPANATYIYIPAPTRDLAQSIADGLDSHAFQPIDFDYRPTPSGLLAAAGLTQPAA